MQVHVGAVEHRIAFADHGNHASGFEMRGDLGGGFIIEVADRVAITGAAFRQLGRDRIEERQFDDAGAHMRRGDRARVARVSSLGEMCNDFGLSKCTRRLERHQLGIAGSDADAQKFPGARHRAHIPGLASALMAAAVMALPPMRPRTVRNGTPRG